MQMILSSDDLAGLSATSRNEILSKFSGKETPRTVDTPPQRSLEIGPEYAGVDMDERADLTFKQIQTWMAAASDKTKLALRVMAEKGPVITAQHLTEAGVENLSHFQSRTTIRTRTVTGDKKAFMLGWDDWSEAEDGEGRYAVTPITYQSLRRYFQLD